MKQDLRKFLAGLGVDYIMEPYGSQPWQVYDEASGVTCSAEVRVMDADLDEIEAEIMFQNPEMSEKPINITLWMLASADPSRQYQIRKCKFKNQDFAGTMSGWQEKVMAFFKACVTEMSKGELPDIEKIEADIMKNVGGQNGKRGTAGSGKFQRINTNMLMHDMKAGGGF